MPRRVIVVEDEADLADLVALHLRREGLRVATYGDGESAMAAISRDPPDLVVLDLMLPGLDGLEICRRVRRDPRLAGVLVLVLTARGEEVDVVTGLELGADDYLVKPFRPRELVARARSLLRRGAREAADPEVVHAGTVTVDAGRHEVRVDGRAVELTRTEFEILRFLAARPGRVRTRGEILEHVGEARVLERTVDVHVSSLRKKLGAASDLVETVRGVGYRLRE